MMHINEYFTIFFKSFLNKMVKINQKIIYI